MLTGADVERYWAVTLPEGDRRTAFPWPGLLCAPVLVIPLVDPSAYLRRYGATDKAHAGLGDSLDAWPVPYWWVDVGASIMAVLVAAAAAELGSLLFGMFTHTASVLAEFGVPEDYQAAGVIALGYRSSDGNRASLSLKVPRPKLRRRCITASGRVLPLRAVSGGPSVSEVHTRRGPFEESSCRSFGYECSVVELGRRAGLVAVLGLLLTLTLGFGITKLTFATGTDSYLNTDDAVYKESIRYQNRFGGEANLTVITMDEGHKVDELTTNPQNMKSIAETADKIRDIPGAWRDHADLRVLELSAGIISTDPQAPTLPNILNSTGTKALTEASKAEGISEADRKLREEDLAATTARVLVVPEEKRFIGTPEWTNFLLYNNQGGIRLAQELVYPDSTHAMIITRMDGNLKVDPARCSRRMKRPGSSRK